MDEIEILKVNNGLEFEAEWVWSKWIEGLWALVKSMILWRNSHTNLTHYTPYLSTDFDEINTH